MPSINFAFFEMEENSSYMENVFQINPLFDSNNAFSPENYLKKAENNFYFSNFENSEKESNVQTIFYSDSRSIKWSKMFISPIL